MPPIIFRRAGNDVGHGDDHAVRDGDRDQTNKLGGRQGRGVVFR